MSSNPYASPEIVVFTPEPKKSRGFRLLELLVVLTIIAIVVALLIPARRGGGAARRTQCKNNLKQIALALHNYADEYGALPPACTADSDGKPLHSWRTLILPYLEQQALYTTIDLSKPWNDSANAEAFKKELHIYSCPSSNAKPHQTTYMAIVGSNSCFQHKESRRFSEITDDKSETLMVIEVLPENAVHWMAPQDTDERLVLGLGPDTELPHTGGMQAAFVDGSVRFLSATMPAAERRAMISIAGDDNDAIDR